MTKSIAFIFIIIFITSCTMEEENDSKNLVKSYQIDTIIVVEEYYKNGGPRSIKKLTLDSMHNGYQVFFRADGSMNKWYWFNKNEKYPTIIIQYDSIGNFQSYKGTPFLLAGMKNNDRIIQVVNPPNIKYLLGYREYKGSRIIKQEAFQPGIAMERGWLTLKNHSFEEGNTYFIYYYFMGDKNKIIDSAYVELK